MSGSAGLPNLPGLGELLKRAREMASQLKEARERLRGERFVSSVGGDLVKVTASGEGEVVKVEIDPSALNPADREMLEDLLAAAVNQASKKAREASRAELSKITGGIDVGGMLGLS